jgi:hypothetical protein
MANTLKLFISPENQRLLATPGAFSSAPPPVFFSGNNVDLELHLYEGVGVARTPYEVPFPAGASVKVAVGTVATRPLAGQWRLSVSSTETTDLDFDATASEVQAALNALSAVSTAGGVAVTSIGDGYVITWNTVGTKPAILAGTDTLTPSSYESILILQAGSATVREIVYVELRQTPVALAETFNPIGTPVVSATTVSAWNGSNKVVRVGISPSPAGGSYTLTVDGDTAVIPGNASISDIRAAFVNAGITIAGNISQTGQNQHDIVFTADEAVTVDGSGLIAQLGIVGQLDLATSEMLAYIGSDTSKSATLEVTITAAGDQRTVCQVPCFVANGVISSGAVGPVPIGTLLTEAVANARYIRRDAAQSPSGADLDIIWPNLGVSLDGSDVADALSGAASPASGNVFATMADIPSPPDLTPYLLITTAASTYQTISGMSAYLTTASASSTYQTIAGMSSYLTTASASSTYAPLTDFDQGVKTTNSPTFVGLTTSGNITLKDNVTPTSTYQFKWDASTAIAGYYGGAVPVVEITSNGIVFGSIGATLTFSDATVQESAPVYSAGTSIHSGGGGHIDGNDYPDEITIVIGGVTYAMPARTI